MARQISAGGVALAFALVYSYKLLYFSAILHLMSNKVYEHLPTTVYYPLLFILILNELFFFVTMYLIDLAKDKE